MFHKGDQIGTFSLIEKLGKGSFGEVWLAEEKTAITTHRAALKLPNAEDVDLDGIRQEADVWETVKGHPNILPIIKADIDDGQIYIASEYAPDGSLSQWLRKNGGKAPSVEIAVRMTLGILAGLEHLHSKGVIHRDLKPANILLQAETPRIADFGIARLTQAANATAGSTLSAGTPSYMAPECFYSIRSEQTDIWSVGVIFHKLLTGKLPFAQPDQVSLMNAILNGEPEIDSEIPEFLRQIIRRALEKDPSARYLKAAEMRQELSSFSFDVLADEDTIAQRAIPIEPQFEKEEVTIVRDGKAPALDQPVEQIPLLVQPVEYIEAPSRSKNWAIALASLLILAAASVWAAFQLTGESTATDQQFSESANFSNGNFNSSNSRKSAGANSFVNNSTGERITLPAYPANSSVTNIGSVGGETDGNSNQGEKPSVTSSVNPEEETASETPPPLKTETPSTGRGLPVTSPSKKPEPTPIDIAPDPARMPRTPRPTPRQTENPGEDQPPLKKEGLDDK